MYKFRKAMRPLVSAVNAATVAALCVMVPVVPVWAEAGGAAAIPTTGHTGPLTSREKTLHALNRLTFGPRPGDEAEVNNMGLEAWFQRQLHPETIDDSAFEQRMAAFPAMQLSQAELIKRFPPPQVFRAMNRRGGGMTPSDPVLKAVYADAGAAYGEAKKKQEQGNAATASKAAEGATGGEMGLAPGDSGMADNAGLSNGTSGKMATGDHTAGTEDTMQAAAAPMDTGKKGKAGKRKNVEAMTGDEADAVLALPPDARMARLVAMSPQEMFSFRAALRPADRPRLMQGLSPAQIEIVAAMQGPIRVVGAEALESRLVRDVYSQRQVQAVMTDFWLNHFSVYAKKNQNEPYLLPSYLRDVILPNSLGNFEQLLVATAKSPAMLVYLDNWQSIGPDSPAAQRVGRLQKRGAAGQLGQLGQVVQQLPKGINENYARELMELHTLGVGGGYTQKDVIEVAKCFTGWTVDRPYAGGGSGYTFEANRHEGGAKVVLGHTIAEGGENEGLEVLHILATSPATAHFVSNKLAVRFVSDTPPAALVNRMAATFTKTNGDIKAVLTTMFHSPEFWAPEVYRAKVKTPIEFMASALRASGASVNNALPLVQAMERLGMPIYGMQTPNGYSWMKDEWVSSNALVSRMNFALVLSGGRIPGTQTNWPALLGDGANRTVISAPDEATEKQLETLLLGQPAAPQTRATVLEQAHKPGVQQNAEQNLNLRAADDADGGDMLSGRVLQKAGKQQRETAMLNRPETPLGTMAGLLLGSPDFQRR